MDEMTDDVMDAITNDWVSRPIPPTPENTPAHTLPTTSAERKAIPLTRGVLDYFPAAIAEIAKVSKAGNDKHNPGQPMHHARGKSTDHADSIARHLLERGGIDPDTGVRHTAELAWRALALLQQELEDAGAPLARGARLPDEDAPALTFTPSCYPGTTYLAIGIDNNYPRGTPLGFDVGDYAYVDEDKLLHKRVA
jgi:hypothetical protein